MRTEIYRTDFSPFFFIANMGSYPKSQSREWHAPRRPRIMQGNSQCALRILLAHAENSSQHGPFFF